MKTSGRGLAILGALGLLYGIFAPWYSAPGLDNNGNTTVSASLFQIHARPAGYMLVGAIWVLVTVLGASATANLTRSAVRWFRTGATLWAYVAVPLTIYCLAKAPSLLNNFYGNAEGGNVGYEGKEPHLAYGGLLSLVAVLAMAVGITLFVRTVPAPTGNKVCPGCAEKVNAAAVVCKHCGHRWANSARADKV